MLRNSRPAASTTSTRQSPVHPASSVLTDQVFQGELRTRNSTRAPHSSIGLNTHSA